MDIYLVRHGAIDPSDQELLMAGNPHLSKPWIKRNVWEIAEKLVNIEFYAMFSGTRHRMRETALALRDVLELPSAQYIRILDAVTNFHNGELYPRGAKDPWLSYFNEMKEFIEKLGRDFGWRSDILLITSGARMNAVHCLAKGINPTTDKEIEQAASFANGEVIIISYDPDTDFYNYDG